MTMSRYLTELRAIVGHRPLMLTSAAVVVMDGDRLLVGRHTLGDRWAIPGGAIDPGETPAQAAVRETLEETGLEVEIVDLVGVWGGTSEHRITYANGDIVDYTMVTMRGRVVGGEERPDVEELSELAWLTLEEIRRLPRAAWLDEVLDAIEVPSKSFRAIE